MSTIKLKRLSGFLFFLSIFSSVCTFAQTPGLVVRPAGGKGPAVLNPNQDFYTSATTAGFTTNDITQSEILYKIIKPIMVEPTGDLATGPTGGYSDIVKTVDNSGCYIFNDGTNLLFRLRIGGIVSGAKAYNILIDTDNKLGATGAAADPNYVAPTNSGNGNPGFELEVALETGSSGRVAIYNVDGIVNPTASTTYLLTTNQLISVALSRESGDADYFYDFFVPISALGISASTPIRIVISTNTNPGSAFQGTRSDIYGIDDTQFSNTTDAWEYFGENSPSFTLNDVTSGGSGPSAVCTAAPTVNSGIASGSNINITGTWTRLDATKPSTATISVYKNGTLAGTTTATSGATWTYTIASVATGDIITAKAQASGESMCLVSNSVTVTSCSPSNISSVSGIGVTCATVRGIQGTKPANARIKIYSIAAGGNLTLFATDNSLTSPSGYFVTYLDTNSPTGTIWEYNGANNGGQNNACSGGSPDLTNTSFVFTVTESGKCESAPYFYCMGLTQTATPVITQTALYPSSATISGTATASSTVRLLINGFIAATTTASVGGTFSFSNPVLQVGDVVTVNAQSAGQCVSLSPTSITVNCFTSVPVITTDAQGNLTAGATTVTGTSSEPAGTTIRVYNASNVLQGSSTVQANGTWSVTVSALVNATGYYATAQNGTCSVSANSSTATARAATTVCPTITGSYVEGNTTVSGTITGPFTGTVYLYQDGGLIGSVALTSQSSWTITVNTATPLYAGGVLTTGAQASGGTLNRACASTTTVGCSAPSTPSISPTSSTISVGQTVTYTVSNTQSGALYIVADATTEENYATSKFGNDGSQTFTTASFTNAGVYTINISADKLSGTACVTSSSATVTVLGASLPVHLLSFSGTLANRQSQLQWRTSTEINAAYYVVERSNDGRSFIAVGQVQASGNSTIEKRYNFTDAALTGTVYFYRLKMVDTDGSIGYSSIVKLQQNPVQKIIVSPNPFTSTIQINATVEESGVADIRLLDQYGRVVYQTVHTVVQGTNSIQLTKLPNLPAAHYLLQWNSNGRTYTEKIMKQ
ncbi:putative secreted protein (Por secretion system target) [Lacibacter cauensis]|uniref:Putative secreted protein (Por secretion system target) n=1 Tax=Lacibacter cauensis TaxID=510947 RepID=A0A562SAA4_9BACT|nr:T9SS type A sorting domain-containing protein [Lacibacter cauensis]TWI78311.1 putative secreted protein (Por secretion system target) [Lacibacter cauensis]